MSGFDEVFGENVEGAEKVQAAQPEPVVEVEAPTQPAPKPEGVIEGVPPAPAAEDLKHVPISAILDEREKRQEWQRKATEYEAKIRQYEEQQRAAQQKPKDFYEDPDGFLRNAEEAQRHAIWNERLNTSEMMAADKHGEEVVNQAAEAFKSAAAKNPALVHEFTQQRDPYGFVVKWHQRNAALSEIGEDPAAYKERIRAELMAEMQAQPDPGRPQPRIPGSLSATPSAGTPQTQPVGSAFDIAFGGAR